MAANGPEAVNSLGEILMAQMPLRSFVLFPHILQEYGASNFPHDSPAFKKISKKSSIATMRRKNSNVVCAEDPALSLLQ